MAINQPRMFLECDDLIALNRLILETTRFEGDRKHGVQELNDLRLCVRIAREHLLADPFKRAALLACALIAYHPFHDGNHRTSHHAAILQLMFEGYFFEGQVEDEKALYNWRYDYEAA